MVAVQPLPSAEYPTNRVVRLPEGRNLLLATESKDRCVHVCVCMCVCVCVRVQDACFASALCAGWCLPFNGISSL